MDAEIITTRHPADDRADTIIRKHMTYAMLGGAIPIPLADLTAVTAVQLDMLKQLAVTYEVPIDPRSSRAFVTSLVSALGGGLLGRIGASAAKMIPGIGWAAGGVAQVLMTGGTTYAVGNLFKRVFREGKTLDSIEPAEVRQEVASYYETGRAKAAELRKQLRLRRDRGGEP